uniref:Uncharacterized protein n=1 Tax=Rhizophora mucronata TaxID=61149 RepID=A0A2P2LSI3_RHIMU
MHQPPSHKKKKEGVNRN